MFVLCRYVNKEHVNNAGVGCLTLVSLSPCMDLFDFVSPTNSCWTLNSCCQLSDGYAKLHERHSSEERVVDSEEDHLEETRTKESSTKESNSKRKDSTADTKTETPAKSSLTSDLLEASARMVKRAVGGSKYQEFHDADSDDLDKDMKKDKPKPPADSSSDDHEVLDNRYKKDKDYNYQELDDEFGSKRSIKPGHEYGKGDSSDTSKTQDEPETKLFNVTVKSSSKAVVNQTSQATTDRIVGHEYGVRPLLDDNDDELSDSEAHQANTKNPFRGNEQSSRGSSVLSGGSNTTYVGLNTPPLSPESQQSQDSTNDIFSIAPFKRIKNKGLSLMSPVQKVQDEDVFSKAPFKARSPSSGRGSTGTLTFTNPAAQDVDVFSNAPFKNNSSKTTPVAPISPASVEMRSPSQSPESQGLLNSAKTQSVAGVGLTPPISPGQLDLFGSGNFANMTFDQAKAQKAYLDKSQLRYPAQQPGKPQIQFSTPQPPAPPGPFPEFCTPQVANSRSGQQYQSPASRELFPVKPIKQVQPLLVEQSKPKRSTPTKQRHNSEEPTLLGGGSSDSQSSEEDEELAMSQPITKKEKRFTHSSEFLQDENTDTYMESNFGTHRRSKGKSKKSSKDKPSQAFSNLSFMDDSEKDIDGEMNGGQTRSESHNDIAQEAYVAAGDPVIYESKKEGSHTLPRVGSRKTKVAATQLKDTPEPFTTKKKSGGLFK